MRIPDLLKTIRAPNFDPPDTDGDYVVFGIIASKSAPKDHKEGRNVSSDDKNPNDDGFNNTSKYMVLTLTDLQWTVDLFLFATAFPRYYKLSPGTLVAILNPSIMPPPPHKTATNCFSLTLSSSDDTVLEIGTARDLSFCKALKRDGNLCDSWVDARKAEFCEFHVNIQLRKAKARRMEVNSGPGILGPGRQSRSSAGIFGRGQGTRHDRLSNEGGIYDRSTGSIYFVTPQVPGPLYPRSSGHFSPANLLDADDIFVAAGELKRGSETRSGRLRKRLADQEHERNLARRLGELGGVGAEYIRRELSGTTSRTDGGVNSDNTNKSHSNQLSSTASTKEMLGLNSRSRNANNVKLGPMKKHTFGSVEGGGKAALGKKTRFVTFKDIKEIGRESCRLPPCRVGDVDDDDLDIM
jgi:minichromosome maintenance protein 10